MSQNFVILLVFENEMIVPQFFTGGLVHLEVSFLFSEADCLVDEGVLEHRSVDVALLHLAPDCPDSAMSAYFFT